MITRQGIYLIPDDMSIGSAILASVYEIDHVFCDIK
jgi:hypothetical protein